MASPSAGQDNYRSYLSGEEVKNTKWRFGVPNYDVVNKLFEEGRTKASLHFSPFSVCVCNIFIALDQYYYYYYYYYFSDMAFWVT
jgi:hypothetical protein